jgi:hypothetical protein
MTALATMVFTVFSSYLVMPSWFDSGSYSYDSTYSSLEECQIAKHGMDAVCAGDSPSHLYVNEEAEVVEEFKKEIEFVKCDYWAGCFTQ